MRPLAALVVALGLWLLPTSEASASEIRTEDELTLLNVSAFVYGAGSGTAFLLAAKPDSAVTATLPFAAITAAPLIAIRTVDGYRPFGRGVPHAMATGLYLGLAESALLVSYHQARANRVRAEDPASELRWAPETTVAVLWGGATAGAILGGALGSSLPTTPGRIAFISSTTVWSSALAGLTAGALLPDDARREERAFALGGLGCNLGLAGGFAFAARVAPSVARVRLVDLVGLGGALASAGLYLSLARDEVDPRLAEGLGALGAGAGLGLGWLLTSGMPKETDARPGLVLTPIARPVAGGAVVGVGADL